VALYEAAFQIRECFEHIAHKLWCFNETSEFYPMAENEHPDGLSYQDARGRRFH